MAFAPVFGRPFAPTFDRHAEERNGLLNALIAYWPLNEASGDAYDAHTNGLTLTDTNTVTSAAGKVYALARQYTLANAEYHVRADDDALLSAGDVDLTIAAWCYLSSITNNTERVIAAKGTATTEYQLYHYNLTGVSNVFVIGARNSGNTESVYVSNTSGTISLNAWYLVIAWYSANADTLNLQLNNGTVDSATLSGGIRDSGNAFRIGRSSIAGALWDGRIGPVAFWKSAAGAGGALTAAQRAALWNGGAGLAYANFTT